MNVFEQAGSGGSLFDLLLYYSFMLNSDCYFKAIFDLFFPLILLVVITLNIETNTTKIILYFTITSSPFIYSPVLPVPVERRLLIQLSVVKLILGI